MLRWQLLNLGVSKSQDLALESRWRTASAQGQAAQKEKSESFRREEQWALRRLGNPPFRIGPEGIDLRNRNGLRR